MSHCKIVVVGDGAVGKTCISVVYKDGEFPQKYIPTVLDNYEVEKTVDNKPVFLDIWDTAGQEEQEHTRKLCYGRTGMFIVCFSVVDEKSLANVETVWIPELRVAAPNAVVLLVGTKTDLRSNPECKAIPQATIDAVAARIKAEQYLECSAQENTGVAEVFEVAVEIAFIRKKSTICTIS